MNYVILLAGIFNIILGLMVYLKNPKNVVNISFMGYSLVTASICLFDFIFRFLPTVGIVRFAYAAAVMIPPTAFFWIKNLINKKQGNLISTMISLPAILLFVITVFTNLVVEKVNYLTFLGYKGVLGPLFYMYSFYIVAVSLLILINLYVSQRKLAKLKRTQLRLVLAGFSLNLLFGAFFSLILPSVFNNYDFTMLDAPSTLFFVGFSAYAIIKHKFLDIRLVVARSVTYLILLATLAAIYAGSVLGLERLLFPSVANDFNLAQAALRTTISVIMVFLFQPLKNWITKATDKVFFKNQYDPQALLDKLAHTVSSSIVLIEMLYKVNDTLVTEMKLSRCVFIILKPDFTLYNCQAVGYKGCPEIDQGDFEKLAKKGTLVYDDLEDGSKYKALLRKYNASISLPLRTESEIVGVFLAGEKNSGDMFSQQDLRIFEIFAPEVSVAIENAKAYEEISRFNVTLRQEVKRATHRLKEKNAQLKELDKAKDEFISMASHQLRTPLTAIKGYLSMLLEGDAGEIKVSQYDFINEAYSAAGRMVGLINDLLNVSRMETGRFFLEPKEVDIERIVDEEVKQLLNHAREKGIYLKIDKKGKVPTIWADETKIRQVVMNFIDNAIYYTTNGGVTVHLSKDKKDFIFQVVDTGIGVPKEQQKHLFEKFFRADNARQTRPDGTGLGIYLARKVTEDHGGKVLFHSEEGKGSTFGFTFPLKARVATKMQSVPSASPSAPALRSGSTMMSTDPELAEHGPALEPQLPSQEPAKN